jgi:hypothetical protein
MFNTVIRRPLHRSIGHVLSRPIGQPLDRPIRHPITRSTRPIGHILNRLIGQPLAHPIEHLFARPTRRFITKFVDFDYFNKLKSDHHENWTKDLIDFVLHPKQPFSLRINIATGAVDSLSDMGV